MRVYVDATPLYNLGTIGETDLLAALDGDLVVPEAVRAEVTTEPAAANLERLLADEEVTTGPDRSGYIERAAGLLGDDDWSVDTTLLAGVLAERDAVAERPCCGLVSDDRRVRRLADGLGASVTSTFGVVVRASLGDKYFPTSQAKRVIRRLDGHGLLTTGPLREQAIGDVAD